MSDDMTPQERTATIMGLYREHLATLPMPYDWLRLSREEIEAKEKRGRELAAEISALANHEDDQAQD